MKKPRFGLTILILLIASLVTFPACAQSSPKPTAPSLEAIIADLMPDVQAGIKSNPAQFKQLLQQILGQEIELVRLVDKQNLLPNNYVPSDLRHLDSLKPKLALNKGNVPLQLRAIAVPALQAMVQAARKDGIILDISSAYRSYQYQKQLFARYVKTDGQAAAERYSAHPGASQHQLGLAIDFGSVTAEFAQTKAGIWLSRHAGEYGFSLSYPEGQEAKTGYMFEPWHYRYIGVAAARLQNQFFNGSQQDMLVFLHQKQSALIQWLAEKD